MLTRLRQLTSRRFAPPTWNQRPARDPAVEGLRGAAAIAVLVAHLIAPGPYLDPTLSPPAAFAPLNLSHAAVLLFFVLSGYVIGLATQSSASLPAAASYLRRRARRLMPLNVAAVSLALIATGFSDRSAAWVNLLFLQNQSGYFGLEAPFLTANYNLWSLNYEVVCYLAFLPVWWLRPRAGFFIAAVVAIGCSMLLAPPGFHFLGHWMLGFSFWLAGLALAWFRDPAKAALAATTWPAAALALFATRQLQPLHSPLARFGFDQPDHVAVIAPDLAYLAPAAWMIAAAAGQPASTLRRLAFLSGLPLAIFALYRIAKPEQLPPAQLWLGAGAAIAACVLAGFPVSRRPLTLLAPVGLVSYALYALAAPVQTLVLQSPLPSGSPASWTLRALVVVALALLLSVFLERLLPVWWKKRFGSGPLSAASAS